MKRWGVRSFALWAALAVTGLAWGQAPADFRLGFLGPNAFSGSPAEIRVEPYFCVLQNLEASAVAVEGWSLSVTAENALISDADFGGTAALGADFRSAQLVTSADGTRRGIASSAAFTSNPSPVIPAGGSINLLRIHLRVSMPAACGKARLLYVDDLFNAGGATPVRNRVTQAGGVRTPGKGVWIADLVSGGQACPDLNPNGWIQTAAWNLLFPLTNPYGCDGGGPENMLRSWVAPHDLRTASPRPGDDWGDIDFGGASAATGFEMSDLYSNPAVPPAGGEAVWTTVEDLAALPTVEPVPPPQGDVVDYQALVDFLNQEVVPHLSGYSPRILSDGVLGIAQTHVRNLSSQPVCVDVCTRSDDAVQVWVNRQLITNAAVCRGLAADCVERNRAVLEPGWNRITVLTWEGAGLWSFALALLDPDLGHKLTSHNQGDLVFAGPEPGGTPVAGGLVVTRTVAAADSCAGGNPTPVTLRGNGRGSGSVQVVELYQRDRVLGVSGVSGGGVVDLGASFITITWDTTAAVLNSSGLRYDVNIAPGGSAAVQGLFGGACGTRIEGGAEVSGAWPHTGPRGAFEDSHDIGQSGQFPSGPGSLTVASGSDGQPGTADDVHTMRGSGNGPGDAGDAFHFAYRRVSGDFSATVRIQGKTLPPSGGRSASYGLMARLDCASNSKYSLVHGNLEAGAAQPGDAVGWRFRRNHRVDGSTDATQNLEWPDPDGPGGPQRANQPGFFRLNRRGETFSGYASFDGVTWRLIGSNTWYGLDPDAELLVGCMNAKGPAAAGPGTVVFTDFRVGPLPRAERFDNDRNTSPRLIYRNNFDTVPNNTVPAGVQANCGSGCAGFTPRVVNRRLRLTQEGVFNSATSIFFRDLPLTAATGKIIVEYTVYASHTPTPQNPNPADGLAVVLLGGRRNTLVGNPGSGLGYEGLTRRQPADAAPSFAVEYDCWNGAGHNEGSGAPTARGNWHLGINTGGNINSVAVSDSGLPDMFGQNGVRHRIELTSDGRISVFVRPAAGGGQEGEAVIEGQGEPLGSQGDGEVTVGATGGTGASSATIEIDDFEVNQEDCSDNAEQARIVGPGLARPGETVFLDATSSDPGVADLNETGFFDYRWSLVSGAERAQLELLAVPGTANLRLNLSTEDGEVVVAVTADDGHCQPPPSATVRHTVQVRSGNWVSYDANNDGRLNIADPQFDFTKQFVDSSIQFGCPEAMDFNGDGRRDITDPIAALNFLFVGTAPPAKGRGCQQFPTCGGGCSCGGQCPP